MKHPKQSRFTLIVFLVAAVLIGWNRLAKSSAEENIIIISTSDIHAKIDMMPRLAAFVAEARAQDTARVFLVDAGDRWTGNAYVDMATHAGRPIIELMNELEYDVATFGNHEFDMGLDTLQKRVEDAKFPIVLANVNTGSTPLKQPKPYVIKEANGVKVGFLGIVTNYANGHPDGDDPVYVGTEFFSPEWTAEKYAKRLRRQCDVMVVISHCGLDRDTTNVSGAFPQADVIISGHTHETFSGKAGDVAVVQGTNKLKAVGVTTLKVAGGKVVDINTKYMDLPKVEDEALKSRLDGYYNNPFLTEAIGTLTKTATKTGLAQMMADEGRRVAGTDLGFYHIGGTRLHSLEAGDVTRADIYELEPFQSYLAITTMTLEEIKQMVINKFNDTTNYKESHREDLIPSGLAYDIVTDAKGDAVDVIFRPEVEKELYTVAMSDYVYGNKVYAYPRRPETGRTPLVTQYLIELFGRGEFTPDNDESRVRIIK